MEVLNGGDGALQSAVGPPGTFWYDFWTGPAVGGAGALFAALVVAGSAWFVSSHRRAEAGREEWFRRLKWAQELSVSDDEDTVVAGFKVMAHLAESKLASEDDLRLLFTLLRTDELDEEELVDEQIVDASTYTVDNEGQTPPEEVDHD